MSRRWAIAMLVASAAVVTGCKEEQVVVPEPRIGSATTVESNPFAPAPATRPAAATSPATTQAAAPAESLISIDGNLVLFPPAKLRLDESDGKVIARLFSDDPKGAALDENYVGNSFYLQIELDPEGAKDLDGLQLTYRAPSSERDDSPYGIFLEGRRWVLQPADVRVAFEEAGSGTGSPMNVELSGTFLMFDSNDPMAKPHRAQVEAKLTPTVQARK